jgi:YD repeat-containing protein
MEATGTLPSRESTAWDASEFAGNYPVLFQTLNWHYAPIGTVRDHFEPGFPGALSSETFRRFDTRNGLVICSLDDLERDGDWEKAAWTRWDDAMIADGVQVAAAEEALHILPPGFGNGVEDCRRDLPNGTMVRRTTRVFEPRGFVDTEVQHDATGQSPSRTQNWAYTARGLPDEWIDAAGESHLYGYDPVFGAFLLDTTDPDTTNSFGSTVVHASEVAYCGISGTACPAAAWGLPVSAIDPSGLETVTSYDLGGRAVESWDSLSPAAFGTVVKRQASYGRAVRRAPVDALPGPGTETAPSFTLIQQPIGTPGSGDARTVVSQTFSDGLGRPLLTRTQTVDGEGAPAEQVSGVTVRDERGRAVIAYGACFSYAGWSDGLDLLGAFSPMSPDLGTCAVPPAATSTQWDSHDRAASVEGPDGTILERDFGLSPGIAIAAERLIDPQWGLLSETTVRTAPTLTETTRHGASTFRHTALQGPQPAMPSPDASDLVTWDVRDVLGRRTMLSRTGTPPGEESVWEYDGFDGVVFSADPDQGRFAYEYDGAGRVAARTLLERNAPNVVFRTERAYDAHSRLISEEHLIDAGGVLDPWERTDWEYDTAFPTFGGALADAGGHVGRATSVLQSRWDGFTYADTVGQAWRYDLRGRVVEEAQHRPSWPSFPMGLVSAVPALLVAGYAYADHGVRTKQLVYVDDGVCRATRSRPAVDEMRLRSGERQASRAAHARPHGGRSGVAAPVVSSTARARPASQADRVLVRRPEGRGPGGP